MAQLDLELLGHLQSPPELLNWDLKKQEMAWNYV